MHWDGELRGVLAVAYRREHVVTDDQLKLLEAFGELAAAASPQRQRPRRPGAGRPHRRPDRLPEPRRHARGAAARDRALRAHRPPAVAGAGGHGRLQAGQRGARPPGGRRGAAPGGPRPAPGRAPLRPGGPLRRRRVRGGHHRRRRGGGLRGGGPRAGRRAPLARRPERRAGRHRRQRRRGRVVPGREQHRADRARRPGAAVRQAGGRARRGQRTTELPEGYRPGRFKRRTRGPARSAGCEPDARARPPPPGDAAAGPTAAASRPSACASAPSSCRWPTRWARGWPA